MTEARGQGRACGAKPTSTELLRELTLDPMGARLAPDGTRATAPGATIGSPARGASASASGPRADPSADRNRGGTSGAACRSRQP